MIGPIAAMQLTGVIAPVDARTTTTTSEQSTATTASTVHFHEGGMGEST